MNKSSLSLLVALAAASVFPAGAQAEMPIDEMVKRGDVYDAKHQASKALEYYLPAAKSKPEDVRLLLRIARQYRHLMPEARSKQEKLRLGNTALQYAEKAASIAPNDPEANLSIAISHGKILPLEGSRGQVEGSRHIKSAVDKALSLDPRNDLAWHVLGRWHQVLADVGGVKRALAPIIFGKLPEGKCEDAIACFQKAIALNPNRLMHYIELGRTYAQMGNETEARRFIQKGLAMPNSEKDDPEIKRKGRETLAKLG